MTTATELNEDEKLVLSQVVERGENLSRSEILAILKNKNANNSRIKTISALYFVLQNLEANKLIVSEWVSGSFHTGK